MQKGNLNLAHFEIKAGLIMGLILACFCWVGISNAQTTVVWSEDWEGSWSDNWHADQAVWEAGVPKSGPNAPHGGLNCAATVLSGNYPDNADTRMIRHTTFVVPTAQENPRLRFWHWYSFSSNDYGKVQIKVGSGSWGDISSSYSGYCSVWTYPLISLASYAGKTVSIAFFFHASDDGWSGSDIGPGWYIDDVAVITGPMTFNNPENWEKGLGDWHPERGTWEVGACKVGVGPEKAYSGQNCAATVLAGNYTDWVDSRLISPIYQIPPADSNPRLRFWHWYNFSSNDYGVVQIKVGAADWKDISASYGGYCSVWTYPSIDLTPYAGKDIKIGFFFHSGDDGWSGSDVAQGWYIDDVAIITGSANINSTEGWELGLGNWNPERGTWEVGIPKVGVGPGKAYTGSKCAATVLNGNYTDWVDSRFISPVFKVPSSDKSPAARFWHWYSFSSNDYGKVQIKTVKTTTWKDLPEGYYSGVSGGTWTCPYISLAQYADSTVQICFYFHSGDDGWSGSDVSSGWYIDDLSLIGLTTTIPNDTIGPLISGMVATPNPTIGSSTLTLAALISDIGRGDSKITQAEYFIDKKGTTGAGYVMTAKDGSYSSSSEQVTATFPPNVLWSMNSTHKLYVHGKDEYNNWSNFDSVTVVVSPAVPAKNISIRDTTALKSTTVTIPLHIDDWEKIAGAEIKLSFNRTILNAKSSTLPAALSGFVKKDSIAAGAVAVTLARATGLPSGGGIFLNIDFEVLSTAKASDTTTIAFAIAKFYDENTAPLEVITHNGKFTVKDTTTTQTLASIIVTPSSDTLIINGTLPLMASGIDTEGKLMTIQPNWSVISLFGNIGSVTSTAGPSITFTASGPGDGFITASQDGKTANAVIVVGKTRGDVNLDGADVVNVQDAILGLQIIVNKPAHLYQLWAADYDGSGGLPLENDIQKILYAAVKAMLPKSSFSTKAARVSLGAAEERDDGLVSFPVLVQGRSDLGAGGFEISYDRDNLVPVSVTPGHTSTLLASNLSEKGLIKVSSVDMECLVDGRGVWMNLIFQPKVSLEEISQPTLENIRLFDAAAEPVDVELGISNLAADVLPEHFQLHQNFPNPFNPATTIQFDLAVPAHVDLIVYNTAGQKVQSLVNGNMIAGIHSARWEGRDYSGNSMPAGLYFCRIIIDHGAYSKINKMIFVK